MLLSIFIQFPKSTKGNYMEEFERLIAVFNLFLSNINNLSPVCSIITGDFNSQFDKIGGIQTKKILKGVK